MTNIYKFDRANMLHGENIHISKSTASRGYRKHWHNYYEIIIYFDSNGVCNLNGTDYEIEDGSLFLLTPKDFHHIILDGNEKSASVVVAFTENAVDASLVDKITENAMVLYNIPPSVVSLVNMLSDTFNSKSIYRKKHLEHLLNCLIIEIVQIGKITGQHSSEIHPAVRKAVSYIITKPSEDLSLGTVADMLGVSPTYFSALFRQYTGIGFKKYVTTIRIELAKRLLEDGKLSVLEVGMESGFNTPSQFIRVFKDTVGDTPSEYRRQCQHHD